MSYCFTDMRHIMTHLAEIEQKVYQLLNCLYMSDEMHKEYTVKGNVNDFHKRIS